MTKIVLEAKIKKDDINFEDGGSAVIVTPDWKVKNGDDKIFVRIHSWDEDIWEKPGAEEKSKAERVELGHEGIRELFGKKVKVTIEVID